MTDRPQHVAPETWAALFAHQRAGVAFLAARPRAALYDDMGLGKTATALAAADAAQCERVLVVCPSVVAHNWKREAARWTPTRSVQLLLRGSDVLDPAARLVVTTYAMLLRESIHVQLCPVQWSCVVVDEAHKAKNPRAKTTRALLGVGRRPGAPAVIDRAQRVWLLTGTPTPNDPTELWTSLVALAPERIRRADGSRVMSWTDFRGRYCELVPDYFRPDGVRIVGGRNLLELRDRLRGFALRRLKSDHLDLPPIRWGTVELAVDRLPPELLKLERGKTVEELREGTEFSTWRRLCGLAKAPAVVELLRDELTDGAHKLVVVACHLEVLATLRAGLERFGVVAITGETPPGERQAVVDRFQADPSVRVALLQIVAGGVGITLTAASDVVFAETSFVPGDLKQAADRCHRIGQTRSVSVRVLTLAGSVDGLAAEAVARKAAMIAATIDAEAR